MSRSTRHVVSRCLILLILLWPLSTLAAGPLPGLWVTPLELDFGPVGVGVTSPTQVVTIRNVGLATLTNFADGAPFDPQFGATQNCAGGVAPGASCQYFFTFKPTATGVFTTTSNSSTNAGSFVIRLAGQSGLVAPEASVSFAPAQIRPGETSRMQVTLRNRNLTTPVDDVAFTIVLPTGVQVAASPQASAAGCGAAATVGAAAGANTVSLAGGRIGVGATCLISVNLTATALGSYTISTGVVTSSNSGSSSGASGVLEVAPLRRYLPLILR